MNRSLLQHAAGRNAGSRVAAPILTVVALAAAAAGCGPRIAEVSGVVTVDGRPQPGLKLIFEPEAPQGQRAMALTGSDGRYTLARQGLGNTAGAVTGRYIVRVYADPEEDQAPKIPPRYGRESTMTMQVEPGRSNTFDIAIEIP